MKIKKIQVVLITNMLLTTLFVSVQAQVQTQTDSPDISWQKIENDDFKLIFPKSESSSAQRTFNLLNYYKPIVSADYEPQKGQLPLILRSELAAPNGFVTLAPRRSEWFMSSTLTPSVGSLEWYQTLAIHEYRHVVQIDYLNRSNLAISDILFGDSTTQLLMFWSMPTWFFEGDAVWAETVFSDSGRGRSPRFSARLKTLVQNNQIPTLNELLAGDYKRVTPNHYVFGYYLITKGREKFGNDIWKEVSARATDMPLDPFAFYTAFTDITWMTIDDLYNEVVDDLRKEIKKDIKTEEPSTYYTFSGSKVFGNEMIYLRSSFDSQWTLYQKNLDSGIETKITEIDISPGLSQLDLNEDQLIYTQLHPHFRYGFKSSNDIWIYDIKKKSNRRLTFGERYYHPKFNEQTGQFIATQFSKSDTWTFNIFDNKGKLIKKIPSTKDHKFVEAIWANENTLYAISIRPDGKKQIISISITDQEIEELTPPTRNNIYSLDFNQKIYFEADFKGATNIFSLNPQSLSLSQCSFESIQASEAHSFKNKLLFHSYGLNGNKVKIIEPNCQRVDISELFMATNYLSKGSTDNYFKRPPVFEQMQTKKHNPEKDYFEYDQALTPHSWSFISGDGLSVQATSSNLLGSLSLTGFAGYSYQDKGGYGSLLTSYSKYYPIFQIGIEQSEKNLKREDESFRFKEKSARAAITLPYLFSKNFFFGSHNLTFFGDYIEVGNNGSTNAETLNSQNLTGKGIIYQFSINKKKLPRYLLPNYAHTFQAFYQDTRVEESDAFEAYLAKFNYSLFTPGFKKRHHSVFSFESEARPDNELAYNIQEKYNAKTFNTFSRGYEYEFTPLYKKYSLEYKLPLAYPNWSYKDWVHINQIELNLFFDHTLASFDNEQISLNSEGLDLIFHTLSFRKLPLNYGVRLLYNQRDEQGSAALLINL